MSIEQLPMPAADELLIEVVALRAEVTQLRPIADAAAYVHGPAECIDPDGDCDERQARYEGWWCSHVEHRHATYGHVQAHSRLADLVGELRGVLLDLPGAEEALDLLREGLYAIVVDLQGAVDTGADEVVEHPVYATAVDETDEDHRQLAMRDGE